MRRNKVRIRIEAIEVSTTSPNMRHAEFRLQRSRLYVGFCQLISAKDSFEPESSSERLK